MNNILIPYLNYFPACPNRVSPIHVTLSFRKIPVRAAELASLVSTSSLPFVVAFGISFGRMSQASNVDALNDGAVDYSAAVKLIYERCSVKIRDFHQPVWK